MAYAQARIDLEGRRFGRLVAVSSEKRGVNMYWTCRCDCGGTAVVRASSLTAGGTSSCGCFRREVKRAAIKHGHARTKKSPTYTAWASMRHRCTNKNNAHYEDYGGRGVTVCTRWERFENFLEDMGECPFEMEIDRFPNNDGNYEPGNCRWATRKQQQNNMRSNRLLTYQGRTQTMTQWAEELQMESYDIRNRLNYGWSIDRIFTTPVRAYRHKN